MAKVYDALKQVEAERSRQLRAELQAVRRLGPASEPTFWKRWSERLARNGNGGEVGNGGEHGVRERMDTILGRLDAFEHRANERLPELERNLRELLEKRIDAVERELGASVSTLGNQMRQGVAVLNRRVSYLLAAVAVLLVALLVRT